MQDVQPRAGSDGVDLDSREVDARSDVDGGCRPVRAQRCGELCSAREAGYRRSMWNVWENRSTANGSPRVANPICNVGLD